MRGGDFIVLVISSGWTGRVIIIRSSRGAPGCPASRTSDISLLEIQIKLSVGF